jgi:hypothetical protein
MKKRDYEEPHAFDTLLSDAALGLSNVCRRITMMENSIAPIKPTESINSKHQQQPSDEETRRLRESLRKKERECSDFSLRMSKLSQSHIELEQQLMIAKRELLVLQADQITRPLMQHPPLPTMPINTQGKDALYWHQACRTLQRQYNEVRNELENKKDQFIRLNDSYRAAVRRLEEVESLHGTEIPRAKDTQRSAPDCGSSAP